MSSLRKAIDNVYLLQFEGEEGTVFKVARQQDTSTSESRPYETIYTKDGPELEAGEYEGTHSMTALMTKNGTYIKQLKDNLRKKNPSKLIVWEVDLTDLNDKTTIPAEQSIDALNSIGTTAGSEGNIEVSIETQIAVAPIAGEVEVTPAILAILQRINEEREFTQPNTAE